MVAKKPFYYSAIITLLLCIALLCSPAMSWDRFRSDAPERYAVARGDTLWDIAARFLNSPWQWPDLWQANPQIRNPHLIYPGDILVLDNCQGTPCLSLERGQGVVKLSPQMRTVPRREAVAPLPMEVVSAFLREHRVLDEGATLNELAYVVGGDNQRLISGAGDTLYVRGELPARTRLGIYRQSDPYEAIDGTPLGMELINIGEARYLSSEGDIARVEVLSAHQEVRNNDILLPLEEREQAETFQPRAPLNDVAGHIIAVPGGVRFIGRLQVVALDLGAQDGIQPGHVLRVDQQGERVHDPRSQELIQLPATEAGLVMVFKPYDQVSYALVMQATNMLAVGDVVRTPSQ
ncbi:LysM peptidoglycan-binding domain-containing protein [Vreelandella olivaria]|uniref:LysM peptidoglycan-binding domain-containing protein n=1 Tax=Vreelandella olivaria TaxID=390919 RepID=UPI00201F5029|nr:LysM domain-containing protein [Halomonas olivaria]